MNNPREFLDLPQNWDSYGGVPATSQAVETAEKLCYVPCSDGGVQIELHAGGAEVEIEISPWGKIVSVWSSHESK